MNKKINTQKSELIGAHVGDGTLYKTNWSLVWELRGGLNEKDYYHQNIVPLLKSIFNIDFIPKFRSGGKNGCFGIQTSNKDVSHFFLTNGFNPGRKTHTVRVPDYIKKANDKIKCAFVRGLFDTDGCLRFERINNNKDHTYPRIEFTFASIMLRDDLLDLLTDLGFKGFKWGKKYYHLCLSGVNNLEKFIREISPKNKKHLNKYEFWKIYGRNNPDAAVA
tara:strand:- start:60 stop:719 length:660 start_codon:yes stop_codon:yes gene_type:complete